MSRVEALLRTGTEAVNGPVTACQGPTLMFYDVYYVKLKMRQSIHTASRVRHISC
jgi:hypothetical protein